MTVGTRGVGSGAATFVDSTGFLYLGVENNFGELPPAKLSGYVYEDAGNDGVRKVKLPGDHHFGGDYDRLAEVILKGGA